MLKNEKADFFFLLSNRKGMLACLRWKHRATGVVGLGRTVRMTGSCSLDWVEICWLGFSAVQP